MADDKIGAKIRRAREQKIPYMLVVGAQEQEQNAVAIRTRKDQNLGAMPLESFVEKITAEVKTRALPSE